MADCPICSKGTVLDSGRSSARRTPRRAGGARAPAERAPKPAFSGPNAATPAYEDDDGEAYVVRLERVPGGVRLAEWSGSKLRRRAPQLPPAALIELVRGAGGVLADADARVLARALEAEPSDGHQGPGVSKGRSGDFREELRVEPVEDLVRVARWVLRPAQGWQLQEAAPMLPAKRYAEAIAGALRSGVLPAVSNP